MAVSAYKKPYGATNVGKQLNPRTLNSIIEKYSRKIGMNFNVSPHSARATFISTLLDTGVSIVDVAKEVKSLGYNGVKITSEISGVAEMRIRRGIKYKVKLGYSF